MRPFAGWISFIPIAMHLMKTIVSETPACAAGDDVTNLSKALKLAGEIREYERFSTVCANCGIVRPVMARYLQQLQNPQLQKPWIWRVFADDAVRWWLTNSLKQAVRFSQSGCSKAVPLAGSHWRHSCA